MERRTASSIREVLGLLPEPPRAGIEKERDGAIRVVVRDHEQDAAREEEEEEDDDDPVRLALRFRGLVPADDGGYGELYRGLFLYERPGSDELDAAWKAAPLVLHDRGLVAAADALFTLPPYLTGPYDFSGTATKLLRRHPGPVFFFRVDSSACPGPEVLAEWVDLLSEKAVCHLTVLNLTQSQNQEFPLQRLRGGGTLISLCLSFFDLSRSLSLALAENAEATFGALHTMVLGGCSLNGQALSSVIRRSLNLTTLRIWGSDLTAGCRDRVLKVASPRLRAVELVRCRAIALTIESPALQQLLLGVSSSVHSKRPWVEVELLRADSLREIESLMLLRQRLSFETTRSIIVNRRRVTAFPCMHALDVGVDMCNLDHFSRLVRLLHSMPLLTRLSIWRTDAPRDEEGEPEDFKCRCVAESLQSLMMMSYRGGAAELAFVKTVLRRGRRLTDVTVYPDPTLPLPRRDAHSHVLNNCPKASRRCSITVVGSLG